MRRAEQRFIHPESASDYGEESFGASWGGASRGGSISGYATGGPFEKFEARPPAERPPGAAPAPRSTAVFVMPGQRSTATASGVFSMTVHGFGGGGYDASMTVQAIEWGMDPTIKLTSRFIKRYCVPSAGGGAVALLGSNAFARISGLCPAGMDLSALKAAIEGLGTVAT